MVRARRVLRLKGSVPAGTDADRSWMAQAPSSSSSCSILAITKSSCNALFSYLLHSLFFGYRPYH